MILFIMAKDWIMSMYISYAMVIHSVTNSVWSEPESSLSTRLSKVSFIVNDMGEVGRHLVSISVMDHWSVHDWLSLVVVGAVDNWLAVVHPLVHDWGIDSIVVAWDFMQWPWVIPKRAFVWIVMPFYEVRSLKWNWHIVVQSWTIVVENAMFVAHS